MIQGRRHRSYRIVQTLSAKRKRVKVTVSGLQSTPTGNVSYAVEVTLRSRLPSAFRLKTEALVPSTLTNLVPACRVSGTRWKHIRGLQLADSAFDVLARVDAIFGADIFA